MNDVEQKCLNCDKPLKGRIDKKYCDEHCRNEYFNKRKEIERKEIRTIDLALKKNRRILKEILKEKEFIQVEEKDLQLKGFVFLYHTHNETTKQKQNTCVFCYDYGYIDMQNGLYKIIKAFKSV